MTFSRVVTPPGASAALPIHHRLALHSRIAGLPPARRLALVQLPLPWLPSSRRFHKRIAVCRCTTVSPGIGVPSARRAFCQMLALQAPFRPASGVLAPLPTHWCPRQNCIGSRDIRGYVRQLSHFSRSSRNRLAKLSSTTRSAVLYYTLPLKCFHFDSFCALITLLISEPALLVLVGIFAHAHAL